MMENITVDVSKIILSSLKEIAELNDFKITAYNEKTSLYGNKGYLDSMALVPLIADIEGVLSEKGYDITIASEKAFSRKISPFLNVKTLKNFIYELIDKSRDRDG